MTDILQFLQQRNSASRLIEPAPSATQLQGIFRAALRAPDHAWLRPWRFITVAGERREAFGELLEQRLLARTPDADATGGTDHRPVAHAHEHRRFRTGGAAGAAASGRRACGFHSATPR